MRNKQRVKYKVAIMIKYIFVKYRVIILQSKKAYVRFKVTMHICNNLK